MHRAFLLASLALGGCLGTLDSSFRVHGTVAGAQRCTLTASSTETGRKEEWTLSGEFTETVIAGSARQSPYDLVVSCNGKVVKTLNGVRPSYENWQKPVELGTLGP